MPRSYTYHFNLPYGKTFIDRNKGRGYNNIYKYNTKELQDELGLNWYDYGARNYEAALGRWFNLDPLAENRTWLSPYNYVQNNPLSRIDPDGAFDDDFKLDRKTGEITKIKDTDDKFDRLYATDDDGNIDKSVKPLVINKEKSSDDSVLSLLSNENSTIETWDTGNTEEEVTTTIRKNIAITANKKDAYKTFKFLTNNSEVEWSLHKFKLNVNGFIGYQIGTYHLGPKLLNGMSFPSCPGLIYNHQYATSLENIHSHPFETGAEKSLSLAGDGGNLKSYYRINPNGAYRVYFPSDGTITTLKWDGLNRSRTRFKKYK